MVRVLPALARRNVGDSSLEPKTDISGPDPEVPLPVNIFAMPDFHHENDQCRILNGLDNPILPLSNAVPVPA